MDSDPIYAGTSGGFGMYNVVMENLFEAVVLHPSSCYLLRFVILQMLRESLDGGHTEYKIITTF